MSFNLAVDSKIANSPIISWPIFPVVCGFVVWGPCRGRIGFLRLKALRMVNTCESTVEPLISERCRTKGAHNYEIACN